MARKQFSAFAATRPSSNRMRLASRVDPRRRCLDVADRFRDNTGAAFCPGTTLRSPVPERWPGRRRADPGSPVAEALAVQNLLDVLLDSRRARVLACLAPVSIADTTRTRRTRLGSRARPAAVGPGLAIVLAVRLSSMTLRVALGPRLEPRPAVAIDDHILYVSGADPIAA